MNTRLAANPNDVSAIVKKAGLLSEHGRLSEAITEYDKALTIDSANVDALFGLGQVYYEIKHFAYAVQLFEKARSLDSTKRGVSQKNRDLKEQHGVE